MRKIGVGISAFLLVGMLTSCGTQPAAPTLSQMQTAVSSADSAISQPQTAVSTADGAISQPTVQTASSPSGASAQSETAAQYAQNSPFTVTEDGRNRAVVSFTKQFDVPLEDVRAFLDMGYDGTQIGMVWSAGSMLYDHFSTANLGEVPHYVIPPKVWADYPVLDMEQGKVHLNGTSLSLPNYEKNGGGSISQDGALGLYVESGKKSIGVVDLRQQSVVKHIAVDKLTAGEDWKCVGVDFVMGDLCLLRLENPAAETATLLRNLRNNRTFLRIDGLFLPVSAGASRFGLVPVDGGDKAYYLDFTRTENAQILENEEWNSTENLDTPSFSIQEISLLETVEEASSAGFSSNGRWMFTKGGSSRQLRIYDTKANRLHRTLEIGDWEALEIGWDTAMLGDDCACFVFSHPQQGLVSIVLI